MGVFVVGLNHRTASLELREQLAVSSRDIPAVLSSLRGDLDVGGAVILSTCNRVELYVSSTSSSATHPSIVELFSSHSRLSPEILRASLYHFGDEDAVRHLFRVTAGLDSMILGESEITAQVKQAYLLAYAHGTTDRLLNRLFQKALHSAKAIRHKTDVALGQASIGSVVLALARQLLADRLKDCQALLWGAGKAAEATARHLIKGGVRQLWIVNRTQAKAADLACACQGRWLSWEQALKHLAHVDIAIVCTQAPHYVIDASDVAGILPARGLRPLFIVDLAVPRNVDPSVAQQKGVHLYNIDGLQSIAQVAVARREQELVHCEALIERQVGHFLQWLREAPLTSERTPEGCQRLAERDP